MMFFKSNLKKASSFYNLVAAYYVSNKPLFWSAFRKADVYSRYYKHRMYRTYRTYRYAYATK